MTIYYSRSWRPDAPPEHDGPPPRALGGWSILGQAVVGVGGAVTAIVAVLSLWPGPDADDSAAFTSVRATPDVPLSEYRQRVLEMRPVGGHESGASRAKLSPGVRIVGVEVHESAGAPRGRAALPSLPAIPGASHGPVGDPGDAVLPVEPRPTTRTSQPGTSEPSGTSPLRHEDPNRDPSATDQRLTREQRDGICEPLRRTGDDCRDYVQRSLSTVKSLSLSPQGEPLSADLAAQRAADMFKNVRRRPVRGAKKTSQDAVGVVLTVNVELTGLRGRPTILSWSIWQREGRHRLPSEWLGRNFVASLTPTSDRVTASVDYWVPLPESAGTYLVRSSLHVGDDTLASEDSTPIR